MRAVVSRGLTRADVLAVLPVLIVVGGFRMHGPGRLSRELRRRRCCSVLDMRLGVGGGALRRDDSRGCEELVNQGAQVSNLSGIQSPVVELSLPHALL